MLGKFSKLALRIALIGGIIMEGNCSTDEIKMPWKSCSDIYITKRALTANPDLITKLSAKILATVNDTAIDNTLKIAILTKALYTLCPVYSQFTSLVSNERDKLLSNYDFFSDYNSKLAYVLLLSQTESYQGIKIRDGFEECVLSYADEAQKSILNQEEKKKIGDIIKSLTKDVVR